MPVLPSANVASKEQDEEDQQNKSKPTSTDHRPTKVKSAATEQEH